MVWHGRVVHERVGVGHGRARQVGVGQGREGKGRVWWV